MQTEKKIIPIKRAWQAAEITTLLQSWVTSPRPVDHDIRTGLKIIRTRARDAAQNSDHARQFLGLVKANVVGRKGVSLQAKNKQRNGKLAQRVNEAVEQWWKAWNRRGACDVTGKLSGVDLQRMVIETVARDGECIVRYVNYWGNDHAFAVQIIDPEALDVDYNADLPSGNLVRMGVEMDDWRRPVAYHLRGEPGPNRPSYQSAERARVPADEIAHLYLPEWVWQTRGVPWMATALHRIKMLSGYEDAAVTAARAGAAKMGFYKPSEEVMPTSQYNTGERQADGSLAQEMDAGQLEVLPPGYDFQGWDPTYPHTDYADFIKAVLRSIAAGLGVSYNALASDLEGVNYSSLRSGALQERDLWMMLQDWFIEAFLQPLFDRWLYVQLALGRLTEFTGSQYTPERIGALERVTWQARRWPWVDPLKDMQANREAIDLRVTSISRIIREQGEDPEEVWQELANDREMLASLGLEQTAPSASAAKQSEQEEPANGEDEDR